MSKNILYANFFHETHTFLPDQTGLKDFETVLGPDILNINSGNAAPRDGFFEYAGTKSWNVIPSIDMSALPSAMLSDDCVHFFIKKLTDFIDQTENQLDGIFLVLHGASASQTVKDVEGEIFKSIRKHPKTSDLPLVAVCDFHANVSPAMIEYCDALIPYRNNPHTDARYAAKLAAYHLDHCFKSSRKIVTRFHCFPLLLAPFDTGTDTGPLATIQAMCRKWEYQNPHLLTCNFFAGFAYADTPHSGVSFSIIHDSELANAEALFEDMTQDIAKILNKKRRDTIIEPEQWIAEASEDEPVIIAEPSDNIGAGTSGDGTGLLRLFVERNLHHALVVINDPEAVQHCLQHQPQTCFTLPIGGKTLPFDRGPLELNVELLSTHKGVFKLLDSKSHLASIGCFEINMGDTCLVRYQGIIIVLTSRKTLPFDLGQLVSLGLDPKSFKYIGVKAAVAHRQAYNTISNRHIALETPGPCPNNLKKLRYQYLTRPIVPLDSPSLPLVKH